MRSYHFRLLTCLLLVFGLAAASVTGAAPASQDWPNWRGPFFNGSAEASGLPVKFSPTEGLVWSTELPGPSAATPVTWGDSVFVSSTEPEAQQLLALCLDRKTGAVKWRQNVGTGYRAGGRGNDIQIDERSNYASPSPVTDGKRVIFFYGNGDLVAFDFTGKKLWQRSVQRDYGDFNFNWTFASTPQLYDGRLYVQVLQRDQPVSGRGRPGAESYLLALEPATGKELWRAVRPSPARMESREAYSTPIPFENNGRKEILISGGSLLSGHDAGTGTELWRWGTWDPGYQHPSLRLVPSPVAGGGVILGCGPKREPVYAVRAGASGDVTANGLAWRSEPGSPITTDVPTPLFYRGKFYVLSDVRKALTCVEPATGSVVWSTAIPGFSMCWGSPTGADGKIYLISLSGEVRVVDAAKGDILATNPMAEGENEIRSTIAIAHNQLLIRTNTRLFCVGK